MSNEMPEKIWAGLVFVSDKKPTTYTSTEYTRTDTIPSKAEVAREFVDAVFSKNTQGMYKISLAEALGVVLHEWQDGQ